MSIVNEINLRYDVNFMYILGLIIAYIIGLIYIYIKNLTFLRVSTWSIYKFLDN